MLDLDRRVARERGLRVETIEASMNDLSALVGREYDLVIQPVSSCYIADVARVYVEVAKVCAPGALYISQHKQPASLQTADLPSNHGYLLHEAYHRSTALPAATGWNRESGTVEFLHRLEDLLGGLCRNGFVIEDFVEPRHADPKALPGSFAHHSLYTPPFLAVKARRQLGSQDQTKIRFWTPS
jgi:hypothetical protein